ncbi:MAG: DUF1800 domain-containing protein [Ferruginibacter sp.]
MERKEFLTSLFKPSALKKAKRQAGKPTEEDAFVFTGGIATYTGSWTDKEVMRLLKRTTFGAPVEEIEYFKTLTISDAVDMLVNTIASPSALGEPVKMYTPDATTPSSDPDLSVPAGSTWVRTPTYLSAINRQRRESIKTWWLNNMINQPRSIEEKMILFWSTHLTIEFSSVGGAVISYQYLQLLRKYALGNFKVFIKEITLNPAMLIYLNGYVNNKTAPDENYGRELQELFTVGKGPDSHYTEDDVKAAARVLTGYGADIDYGVYNFNINKHDTNPKQFSAFYDNTVISRSPAEAQLEVDDLINMIFSKEEVSKNICRRLYRYFVYHDITAETEAAIITPLAQTFRDNNYEIKPVLLQLLKSEHFFDVLQYGGTIKSGVDFAVGLVRECGIKLPPKSNPLLLHKHLNYFVTTFLANAEQNIGDPPNVSGFPAYYQTPFFGELWINTDSYTRRKSLTGLLANDGYSNGGFKMSINAIAVASRMSNPADPDALVLDFNKYFLGRELSAGLRNTIKTDILLTGLSDNNYWTAAWNAYINNPADLNNFSVVNLRLRSLLQYFLSILEEYHLE